MPPKCWEKYLSTCNCVPRKTVFQEWEWIKPCADKNSVYCQELHKQGTSKVCTLRKKRNPERWLGTRRNDDIWGNKRKRVNGKDIVWPTELLERLTGAKIKLNIMPEMRPWAHCRWCNPNRQTPATYHTASAGTECWVRPLETRYCRDSLLPLLLIITSFRFKVHLGIPDQSNLGHMPGPKLQRRLRY